MQEPRDTVHHSSGKLNEEGLSEEWMKVMCVGTVIGAQLMESHSLRANSDSGPRSISKALLTRIEKFWSKDARYVTVKFSQPS
jgi:hypothetical protein